MKTLYLVRHAKSDWDNKNLSDIDRPLNTKGYADAHKMSLALKEKNIFPDLIITSPAIRAISTALIFAGNLKFDPSEFVIDRNLYETNVKHYINTIAKTDNHHKDIMLFGHNPIITDCANSLTASFTEKMATCSIVGIRANTVNWALIGEKLNELIYYAYP